MGSHVALLELRDRVFAIRAFRLHGLNIGIFPMDGASGAGPARLQAGATVEDDHDVLAEGLCLFFLSFAQALASSDHQDD